MILPRDFVNLKYSNDLTQAGVNFACQVLPYQLLKLGRVRIDEIREIVCEAVVELAFRRFINLQKVPHDILVEKPYSNPLRSEIAIGGRRCKLICKTLTKKSQIKKFQESPITLMEEPATIRGEMFRTDSISDNDLLIFCILNALITPNHHSISSVSYANLPTCLIHTLPQTWTNPNRWAPLDHLTLEGISTYAESLRLIGLDDRRKILTEEIQLSSKLKYHVKKDFFTLSFIHANSLPENQIVLRNVSLRNSHSIHPNRWKNIWIYGLNIILLGFITLGNFRERSQDDTFLSRITDSNNYQIETLSIPYNQLHPIEELVKKGKIWRP